MTKWTVPQQNAINAKNSNILVNAAAGSGKTAVLVERVIKTVIDDGVPIDKLLIVTFTNAAASEMRNRIAKKLREVISTAANEPNSHEIISRAKRQYSLLPGAMICTIDSFCINFVRENFFKLDIQQDFSIMDDSQRMLVEQTVLDEIIDSYYESGDNNFYDLVEMFSSSKNDSDLSAFIRQINLFTSSQAFPDTWLDEACEMYNPSVKLSDSFVAQHAYERTEESLDYAVELINNSLSSLVTDDLLYDKYKDMLLSEKDYVEYVKTVLEQRQWDKITDAVNNVTYIRMPTKRGYTSPSKAIVTANRAIYKELFQKKLKALYSVSADEYEQDCKRLYPMICLLCKIIKEFSLAVKEEKRKLNSYTFADVEHFAIELLFYRDNDGNVVKTDLAKELSDNFYEILVDEYQDTNSAQDTLFKMLSNGHNRFMVGDMKQSIYRFRLAMPQIFNAKKEAYADFEQNGNKQSYKINLDTNFRSRAEICSYVNFVFSHFMSSKVGEVNYDGNERLNNGLEYEKTDIPSASLYLLETPEDKDANEYEAEKVAEYIMSKVQGAELVMDKNGYRPIKYGDFAILMRSDKDKVPVFAEVFSRYGIPTVFNNKSNLFSANEVLILLNLLRSIDNPLQDVPLLATLMSAFYGFTPDDLARAKLKHNAKNLYNSIIDNSDFSVFVNDLKRYREYASSMSVESLIRTIISETSYLSVISAMGNHEQRVLNVMKLVDIAKRFDGGDNVGLTSFLRYVDAIIDNKFNIESPAVTHTDSNAVNIMTIHKSKGLEFPVCILAGSSHQYNTDDTKKRIQLNSRFGIGLKVYNEDTLSRYDSLQYTALKEINSRELMSENLRVLYVALTRAREQFVTFYTTKNIRDTVNKKASMINDGAVSPLSVQKVRSDGDFIITAALLHKDGQALRDMCDVDVKVDMQSYDFDMSVNIITSDNALQEAEAVKKPEQQADIALLEEIKKRLSFRYDRLSLANYPSKLTASSLDEAHRSYEYLTSSKPAFLTEGNMTSAQKGTAMHTFMQYCDYDNARRNLQNEIDRLVSLSYITLQQAQVLNKERLNEFFNSELAHRIFNGDRVYREYKISAFVPVCDIENTEFDDEVLIQGIADCVFEENGELVLVDYKTDRAESEIELLDKYKNQVAFYRYAIEKSLKKPVKEAALYSFYLNKPCIYK